MQALKDKQMWENTVLVFVADNGGPLDHCTNAPLRGGKHTFFEGGVRVTGVVSGPVIPEHRRGKRWDGLAASADWYHTVVEGMAAGRVPADTGPRAPDGFNLWPAMLSGDPGPRNEVVHQVQNQYCCDKTHGDSCSSSIRIGDLKLIVGNPGASVTFAWPELVDRPVPFGESGGVVDTGTGDDPCT